MISQTNGSAIAAAYPSKANEVKEQKQTETVSSQGENSKVDELKKSIDSGEYKVDINALSQKMADSLL
ncbi:flagellar biosynthesis anti-sigma factor FlgM [Sulfurimonas sp. SAG-AH-194-C21]|nr:flagellar biosynthesis anti-sigma factor FlgM [Sulfurimonas sp. SAG-AH-194-C21]MDF1884281.1 flagellar biosynthesis anti-sigma factor FlgM [Sulfurimonas sp. SAG-AH-194-C21]